MRNLLNKARATVKVKFLGENVEVRKLSVTEVKDFQKELKKLKKDDEDASLGVQRQIIRLGVVGAEDLTDDELDSFPLADIAELAKSVLTHAGVGSAEGNA